MTESKVLTNVKTHIIFDPVRTFNRSEKVLLLGVDSEVLPWWPGYGVNGCALDLTLHIPEHEEGIPLTSYAHLWQHSLSQILRRCLVSWVWPEQG